MEISTQKQLLEHFRQQLKTDTDWRWVSGEHLCLELDGKKTSFDLQAHVHYNAVDLEQLAKQKDPAPLILVPELTDRFLGKCKQSGLSVIDLNGRTWIRGEGLYIERPPLPDRKYRNANKPEDRFYQVSSTLDLLDAWVASDSLKDRTTCIRLTGLETDPWFWADRVEAWAQDQSIDLAFTQWTAAWERHGYTEPVICSAYISEFPRPDQLAEWGAREVSEAGALWLFKPSDHGVFFETQRHLSRCLVSDAQIYIDLQKTGLRGPEAADALRKWEGFCRNEV